MFIGGYMLLAHLMLEELTFPFQNADVVTTILRVSVSIEYRGAYYAHYTILTKGYIHVVVLKIPCGLNKLPLLIQGGK